MRTLLVINSSSRVTRSITHRLTAQFAERWLQANPGGSVIERDVGQQPVAIIDERWIAAAFTAVDARSTEMIEALSLSETLISELEVADEIVLGVPMYNFGMPGQLKVWFDQIIRVDRTFRLDLQAQNPYTPLLQDKPVTVIISAGDGSLLAGGADSHLNFLEPHLDMLLSFIGFQSVRYVRVGYEEFKDQRWARQVSDAEVLIGELAGLERAIALSVG